MNSLNHLRSISVKYFDQFRSFSIQQWLRVFGLSFAGLSVLVLVFGLLVFGIGLVRSIGSMVSQSFVGGSLVVSVVSGCTFFLRPWASGPSRGR